MEREKMIEEMKSCADSAYYNWDNAPKDPVWRICEGLYDACYRKIPEGSVVLTKEEYELLTNDLAKGDYGDFENGFSQVRKETEMEILKKLNGFRFVMYDEGYEVASWTCGEDDVKQFAKEIGVEVEE